MMLQQTETVKTDDTGYHIQGIIGASPAVFRKSFVSVKAEDGLKRQRRYEILILEKS